MDIVSDWDWGTVAPPRLGVTHLFHLSDPTEARKPWLWSQVMRTPSPRPKSVLHRRTQEGGGMEIACPFP